MMKKIMVASVFPLLILTLAGCTDQSTTEAIQSEQTLITLTDIEEAQEQWAESLISIGQASLESVDDAKAIANETLENLYYFDDGPVLFKPTKAVEVPFRSTKEEALSYFVGGSIEEDAGFALEPWTNIRFDNHNTILNGDTALSSGHYYFTSGDTLEETMVEYTFGYILDEDGNIRIQLQHSSIPFS